MNSTSAGPRLLQEPEGKTIRSLMAPMLLGMIAMIVYNLADIYFVSRLGTSELAALSFTFPVVFLIGAVTVGFGHGTSSVCARLFGAQRSEDVGRITIHAILLAVVTCAVLIVAGLLSIDPLFRFLGADEATLAIIHRYLRIYYYGLIFNVGPLIANPVLRASGDAKTPALIMLISAGLNIFLDPILIFGLFGVPKLGMEGAATATVLANCGTLAVSVAAIRYRGNIVFPRSLCLHQLTDSWRRILQVGIPAMTSAAVAPVTTAFITYQVSRFGQAAVAGYGVASRIEGMVLLVLIALGTAVTPFVGQNYGAGRMDRVANGIRWCQRFSVAYGLSVAVLLAIVAPYVARLFTDDATAISTALMHMRIVPASYLAIGFALAASNSFNAIGKPMAGMIISLTRTILVYAPLAWLLSGTLGLVGIFAAACTANVMAGAVGLLWCRTLFARLK